MLVQSIAGMGLPVGKIIRIAVDIAVKGSSYCHLQRL